MQPMDSSSPPGSPGMSGCQKTLIGCVIGCGSLAVLAAIGGGVGAWWFVRTGKQHPTAAVVSPRASGSFSVGDLGADPGVTALLDSFLLAAQRQQQEGVPPWVQQLQQMSQGGSSPSTGLRMMLPRQATLSIERGAGDEPEVVAAINARGMTKLIQLMLRQGNAVQGTHRGREVLLLQNDTWASVLDGTVLVASDEAALRAAIDRLLDRSGVAAPPPSDLGKPARAWDLTGTFEEREGKLSELLWGLDGTPEGVRETRVGLDVATQDAAMGRVVIDCESPELAAAAARALEGRAAERAIKLAEHELALRTTSRVEADRAVLDWELTGVDRALVAWMAEVEAYEPDDPDDAEESPGDESVGEAADVGGDGSP